MTADINNLKRWLEDMAALIEQQSEPEPLHYAPFLQEPELVISLMELIASLDDNEADEGQSYYSACIFALDICVAQLQAAFENGNRSAGKLLNQLMSNIAKAIKKAKQTLSFWLPVLNAFYEVHIELSLELKDAYLELASQEDELSPDNDVDHLEAIRDMINELSDLSIFDIAENFFAQSYAMPADFFTDLIIDLYSIEEGHDIALLTLLHPKPEVREVVVSTLDYLMDKITLSSISLSRLQTIKNWYPVIYHEQFNRWLKIQRKKGVVFYHNPPLANVRVKASEVDGSGAQGIFLHMKENKKNKLCGLLFKYQVGIKDAWSVPSLSNQETIKYYNEAFDSSISLRNVDLDYLLLIVNHFLSVSISNNEIPDLHLLEIQELLGCNFQPQSIDINYLIEQLSVQINPFTPDEMQLSYKRSKNWLKNKKFTESWFIENAHIDKLVNRFCSFVDGMKVCALEKAIALVFEQEFEAQRSKWLFHFLWIALWAKSKARKNEKIWQDSFFIAYGIYSGLPLNSIPIMKEICHQTVLNSIETMQERRTYLNKE